MKSSKNHFALTILVLLLNSCSNVVIDRCESPRIHFYSNHNVSGFSTVIGSTIDEFGLKDMQSIRVILIDSNKAVKGAYPDSLGLFRIDSVQPNLYKIQAAGLGYKSQALQHVRIQANELVVIDFVLDTAVVDISQVIVR